MFFASLGYLALGVASWRALPLSLSRKWQRVYEVVGACLYFPGISLYWWGYRSLGKYLRPSSSHAADLYPDHELRITGSYAIVRHPMYLGVLMGAGGGLMIYRTWTMVLYALSSLSVIARARHEETVLKARFGSKWEAYRSKVPGWIPAGLSSKMVVPGLFLW
jgi:protein-S-isoprenylcysteine O-methyltransferase Ste14